MLQSSRFLAGKYSRICSYSKRSRSAGTQNAQLLTPPGSGTRTSVKGTTKLTSPHRPLSGENGRRSALPNRLKRLNHRLESQLTSRERVLARDEVEEEGNPMNQMASVRAMVRRT